MTRPKDGTYVPESNRWPGLRKHTPIPKILSNRLHPEGLIVLQSYKGYVLLLCKKCDLCTVVEISEGADWSCDPCAKKKFAEAVGQTTKVGDPRHERPSTRTDRKFDHSGNRSRRRSSVS